METEAAQPGLPADFLTELDAQCVYLSGLGAGALAEAHSRGLACGTLR